MKLHTVIKTLIPLFFVAGLTACSGLDSEAINSKASENESNESASVIDIEATSQEMESLSKSLFDDPLVPVEEVEEMSDEEAIQVVETRVDDVLTRISGIETGGIPQLEEKKNEIIQRLQEYLGGITSTEDLKQEVIARLREGYPAIDEGLEIIDRIRNGGEDELENLAKQKICEKLAENISIPDFLLVLVGDRVSDFCSQL